MLDKIKMAGTSRCWVFTFNVDTTDTKPIWNDERMTFLKYQLEKAPTTGKLHWQGVVRFKSCFRLKGVKRELGSPKIHAEIAKCWDKAVEYVQKAESAVPGTQAEFGEDVGQGARMDLRAVGQKITRGARLHEIARDHPEVVMKYPGGVKTLVAASTTAKMMLARKCALLIGPTGCGKTRFAYDTYGHDEIYNVFDICKPWFDGYEGQKVALLDECGKGMMSYDYLKKLCDIYPMEVPVKGGSSPWIPEVVLMTSNESMENWWEKCSEQHLQALRRRIKTFFMPHDAEKLKLWLAGTEEVAGPPALQVRYVDLTQEEEELVPEPRDASFEVDDLARLDAIWDHELFD